MEKSNKFAWTWTVKEECLDEYVQLHEEPWREVLEEHVKAGIRNYSIFQNGAQFFYCFECDNVDEAFAYIAQSETCIKYGTGIV
jgi:L-rhamnose mutarotase